MFEKNDYKIYYYDILKRIMSVPSPSGYYREIKILLEELAKENDCDFSMTNKGCFVVTIKGESSENAKGICAHCDTLGAMVRSIQSNGSLSFTRIGGPILSTLDGEYCTVITRDNKKYTGTFLSRSESVHVYDDASTRARDEKNMYIRLDEEVTSKEETEALGISNGDYVVYDSKTVITDSDFIKSRFIDDKASVACLFTIAHIIKDKNIKLKNDIVFLITMYEEVGHGASYLPRKIESMLCVDMGCIGDDLSCTEHDVSICAKDSCGPYDYDLTTKLINLAKENGLSYAVDIYPHYGSDIGAMWSAGYDIPAALIGTGVHASHGMERTHFDGVYNTLKLILLYILSE